MSTNTKTYNLLVLFQLQKLVRKEGNESMEFMEILKTYDVNDQDTSKQIYDKLCGQGVKKAKQKTKRIRK
jgi:ABC-type taurine transport system substrate-binding protein